MRIVIKLGGELLGADRRKELREIAQQAKSILCDGNKVLFVHGGGPQTTALMENLGTKPNMQGGRRITDEEALEAIKMMVGGKLNIDLVSTLRQEGINAIGLHGLSGRMIACQKRPPRVVSGCGDEPVDFGYVGDVIGLNRPLLELLEAASYTLALACIGCDDAGLPYNINADAVACDIAAKLGADHLILLTNTPGVLRDQQKPESRFAKLSVAEGRQAIHSGVVQGGMIPKLEESFKALKAGVKKVHILGKLQPQELTRVLTESAVLGTTITQT